MTIKVGVIGYGLSARVFHLPFIQVSSEFELVAVSTSRANQVREAHPGIAVFSDARQMIECGEMELVIVTAPNDVHFSLAKYALEQGRHVVVEKPFVTGVADGEELIKLAEQRGLVLSVFHNRRWDSDYLTVKKLLADGTLGTPRFFETHFDRFRPNVRDTWRERSGAGSGILFDLGPHLIDQTVQLFGLPRAVTAQISARRTGAMSDDSFRLTFHYRDMLAVLVSSPFCAGPNLRFKLEGEAGSYIKYGLDPQEERLRTGILPDQEDWAAEDEENYGTIYSGDCVRLQPSVTGGYQYFFTALAHSLRKGTDVPVTASDGLNSIRLIDAARQSAKLGETIAVGGE